MSLASQVNAFAGRVGNEIKTLRSTYVPNAQRGPIGGITSSSGVTGPVNLDPTLTNHRRLIATGDVTIGFMPTGTDGQRMLIEVNASGGQRTVSFDPAYEVSQAVPVRSFVIASGDWGYFALVARGASWRLVSAEPLSITTSATAPSVWFPADYGYLGWTGDPMITNSQVGTASGSMVGSNIKIDVSGTATQITFNITVAGAGFTANRNYWGLYAPNGVLVAQTGDLATVLTSTGVKTITFTSSTTVTPGLYYAGFISTGTTAATFTASSGSNLVVTGRTALGWRGSVTTATYTSLPANRPTPNTAVNAAWVGIG